MFGKLINNYLYGKSGKGDYTKDDLPTTRGQLFKEMLRVRLSGLTRLNLLYMLSWLPAMLIIAYHLILAYTALSDMAEANILYSEGTLALADMQSQISTDVDALKSIAMFCLLFFVPAITITGPFTPGLCYVTRNWARDEHAFIFSDFKDAVKENWKQGLLTGFITGLVPIVAYVCWDFYGSMASDSSSLYVVPQMLTLLLALIWLMSLIFTYPLMVSYKLTYPQLIRNSLLLTIGRLPQTILFKLITLVPVLIALAVSIFTSYYVWAVGLTFLYYVLFGFAFSRFISASFTNAVFDKYINSKIDGAQVDRGLYKSDDDDDEDDLADDQDQQ
ncbi:MAG TPA: YesL family protein [Candidatus Limiplasma sp.]|nr:YesL family protein [Candidatus Limiplasma sp.]